MIKYLISPSSIAVIGASNDHKKNSGRVILNIQKSKFSGQLYAVNLKYDNVLGVSCYTSILDIPGDVELVCIVVPAQEIPSVLSECVLKKVKMVAIFSSGFSEMGCEGEKLQEEIISIIEGTDLRIYGPNVPGLFDFKKKWGLSFSPKFEPHNFKSGSVGLLTQGGSLGRALIDSNESGIGYSYWVSPGNEIDLDTNDFLEFMVHDDTTEVILMVLESVPNPDRFLEIIHKANLKNKPLVVLKLGHSSIAIKAIESHLGFDRNRQTSWSLYKHPGLIQVDDLDEIIGVGWLLEKYKDISGSRTLIFSWAGGSSILMTDKCEKYGIALPSLSIQLKERFSDLFQRNHSIMNPLDLTTDIYEDFSLFYESLRIAIDSEEYDVILIPIPFKIEIFTEQMASILIELSKVTSIPLIPVFLSTGELSGTTHELITESGIPYFTKTETAIKSLSKVLNYKKTLIFSTWR